MKALSEIQISIVQFKMEILIKILLTIEFLIKIKNYSANERKQGEVKEL